MSMPAFVQDLLGLPRKNEPDRDTRSLRIVHSREADEARSEARQRSLKRHLWRRRRRERELRASRSPSKSPLALW